jgi:hypothetical protein
MDYSDVVVVVVVGLLVVGLLVVGLVVSRVPLLVVHLVQHYSIPATEVMSVVSMMHSTYQPLLAIECV